jgi:hypothetical protein
LTPRSAAGAEHRDVLGEAIAGFVASQVEAADAVRTAYVSALQVEQFHALRRVVGSQRAEDQTGLDRIDRVPSVSAASTVSTTARPVVSPVCRCSCGAKRISA